MVNLNYLVDFHLYYCIVEQKCKINVSGRTPHLLNLEDTGMGSPNY